MVTESEESFFFSEGQRTDVPHVHRFRGVEDIDGRRVRLGSQTSVEAFLVADEKDSSGGAGGRLERALDDRFGGRIPPPWHLRR